MLIATLTVGIASAQQVQSHQIEKTNGLIEVNPGFSNGECIENDGAHRVSVHMLNGEVSRRVLTTRYFLQPDDYTIVSESHYDELAAILSRPDGIYAPDGANVGERPSGTIGVIVPANIGRQFIIAHGYIYGQNGANDRVVLGNGDVLYWVRTFDTGESVAYTAAPGGTRFTVSHCGVYTPR